MSSHAFVLAAATLALAAAAHSQESHRAFPTPGDSAAFHDARAQALFERALHARASHDSVLHSYEAMSRVRMSMYIGLGRNGPRRLIARQESAARVRWQLGVGARVHITGGRAAVPAVSPDIGDGFDPLESIVAYAGMSPVPYFPGHEPLFVGRHALRDSLIHPLARGADAFYRYRAGDSVSLRLGDGSVVALRELRVRPRSASWKLATGSLWLDVGTGQVVRAALRMATPAPVRYDIAMNGEDPIIGESPESSHDRRRLGFSERVVQGVLSAAVSGNVRISALVIEYGLHEGRWWLPRFQTSEVVADVRSGRMVLDQQHVFTYESVNAELGMQPFEVDTGFHERPVHASPPPGLSAERRRQWADSAEQVYTHALRLRDDSLDAGLRVGSMRQCDTSDVRVITQYRAGTRLPVELHIPCDERSLVESADLPPSIFDEGENVFDAQSAERLAADALALSGQGRLLALSRLRPPRIEVGLWQMRYNRVEGFSPAVSISQVLGGGYTIDASARMGTADGVLNAELGIARTNLTRTLRLNVYGRLASVKDWGSPLSFGSSVSSLLFGEDEGFYYRARGAEVLWSTDAVDRTEWRLFMERQSDAAQRTTWSMSGSFRPNIAAARGDFAGVSLRAFRSIGRDPMGWRALADGRLEAAAGTAHYARAAGDLTVTRALGQSAEGALTMAGGVAAGLLPPQRHWYLGGARTIRGQRADTSHHGDAFWLGRLELARRVAGFRLSVFGDAGWTGDRARVMKGARPWSGAGVGASLFEGLARVDVARSIYPERRVRIHTYVNARF